MAYDTVDYHHYYDCQIQQNKQNCRPASGALSAVGNICKLSESYDISAQ